MKQRLGYPPSVKDAALKLDIDPKKSGIVHFQISVFCISLPPW